MSAYPHLGEHVGHSDVCMDCRAALADFGTGWQLCEPCRQLRVATETQWLTDPNAASESMKLTHRGAIRMLVNQDLWTLQEYIDWLNRPEPGTIKGDLMAAPEWACYNITKASELGDYLDGCVEREREKDWA